MIAEPGPEHQVWIDGEFVPWKDASMHICDHHYGFGVFEGVRAHACGDRVGLFRLHDHTRRLFRSAHLLGIEIPAELSVASLDEVQLEIVRRNGLRDAYVRPFVFHAGTATLSPRGQDLKVRVAVLALAWLGGAGYKGPSERGIKLKSSSFLRSNNSLLVKAKAHANYMTAMLALQEARLAGADDALIFDQNGFVAEASAANFFVVRDGRLWVPHRHQALEGITRDTILELAKQQSLPVEERLMTKDDIYLADEAFLSGSAVGITPVSAIDGRKVGDGQVGPLTRDLRTRYDACVRGDHLMNEEWIQWT